MVFIKLCHLTQEKVSLPNQFYYLIASKNLTKSCWHWLWFFTNFRPLAWKCLFWAKKTKCPGINAHICTHLQSHFMNIFIAHVTPLSCFFRPNFQNFLPQFEKKQPVLPIFLFQCLVFLEKSLISPANWQIWLFQAKFSKLFATIWKKTACFTYYSVLVPDFPKKSL